MSDRRLPAKEHQASLIPPRRLTYAEKLRDVRWKRRRDDLLRRSNWTCCECGEPLTTGRMDLQVHHVCYITALDPWDYPDELLLVCCDWHHKERQAVEQAIYVEVGRYLAGLSIQAMRAQPIHTFFEEDASLLHLPAWWRDYLHHERDQRDERATA